MENRKVIEVGAWTTGWLLMILGVISLVVSLFIGNETGLLTSAVVFFIGLSSHMFSVGLSMREWILKQPHWNH